MGKPVNGNAVRIYTLNERATKFRNTAACLSWGEKTGSAEKKAYILSLLLPGATDTRSLGGDLNKQQQEQLIAANKGKFPNRRRKSKRALEAQAPMAVPTPGFQPQVPLTDGEVQGQSDQLIGETVPSPLEGRDTQTTDRNGSMSLNDLSSLGRGSQIGTTQNIVSQDLNISHSGGASYNRYYDAPDNSYPANSLATSHLDPSQGFLHTGGDWSSLNNPIHHSYTANTLRSVNDINFFNPAQYGATYGGQRAEGVSFAAGEARGFTNLQTQRDILVNHPVSSPIQSHKRPRTAFAEDDADSHDNRRNKRARVDTPADAPQVSSAPKFLAGGAESLLRFDGNGFVIQNNTPGMQGQAEDLYPAVFDEFLRDTQHEDNHVEDDNTQNTRDAPATHESNNDLFDEDKAPPVKDSRKRKRDRGSPELCGDAGSDFEAPTAKRQKADPSSDKAGAYDGDESSNDDDGAFRGPSSADSDDDSEYTPSPYHQTSLKTIGRPTTGGKGPYKSNGRPVTGGKGPLKSTSRANIARKTPRKQK